MEKERPAQQVAEIGYVVGDVKGKTAVLVDDMIDTAGTLDRRRPDRPGRGRRARDRGAPPTGSSRARPTSASPTRTRGSSGSSSPTPSRCAPARPTTSRCSRPRRPSPTRSAGSSPTTRCRRSSPARTSCSSGYQAAPLRSAGRSPERLYVGRPPVAATLWRSRISRASQARDPPLAVLAAELQLDRRDRVRDLAHPRLDRRGGLVAVHRTPTRVRSVAVPAVCSWTKATQFEVFSSLISCWL